MSDKAINTKEKTMKGDMTQGHPLKVMLVFAIPMIIGNLFQQFYNIADSIMVGNMIDRQALAAVGASASFTMLFVMFAAGTGIGCSVVISQLFGAKQYENLKTAISTALITVFGFSVFLSIVGRVLSRVVLTAMQTPANILESAEIYMNIYFYGFVFLFLYNMVNSIFNALGASKIPLIFLICSSLLNIGLDYLMIPVMGIAGAAWATLISQAIAAIASLIVLVFKLKRIECGAHKTYDWPLMKRMITIAVPSIIQQSIVSIGMLLIQAAVNLQGDVFMSGYTAAIRIDGLAIVPIVNIGNAVSTFVAQNMGAQKKERAKKGFHAGLGMGVVLGIVVSLITIIFCKPLVGMFMDSAKDIDAISAGARYLSVIACFYFLFAIMNSAGGVLRGAGDMKWFMGQTLANLVVRLIITYSLVWSLHEVAIMIAMPISWGVSVVISLLRYRSGKWMDKKLV